MIDLVRTRARYVTTIVIAMGLLGGACGDNLLPPAPDALEPQPVEQPPCCRLLPDEDAVRACVDPLPPNTCGVLACQNPDGSFHRINVCGPRP